LSIKFLHSADIHIKLGYDDRYRMDLIKFMQFFLDVVYKDKPDYVFLAGDLFDKKVPTPAEYSMLYIFINKILSFGSKIIMTQGNHDEPDNEEADHTLQPLMELNLQGLYIFDEPGLYNAGEIDVLALPYVYHNKEEGAATIKRLHDTYTGNNLYMIAHCWVDGYLNMPTPPTEFVITPEYIKQLTKVKYAALGHIHTYGTVNGSHAAYSGSPFRTTWGDTDDVKVILRGRDDGHVVESLIVPVSPLKVVDFAAFTDADLVSGHMVKLRAHNLSISDMPRLEEVKNKFLALNNVVNVDKQLKPITYIKAEGAAKGVTIDEFLDDYVKKNDIVASKAKIIGVLEKIMTGQITTGASPFTIEELDLGDKK